MHHTEWFQAESSKDAEHERWYWRRVAFAILVGLVLAILMSPLHAWPAA